MKSRHIASMGTVIVFGILAAATTDTGSSGGGSTNTGGGGGGGNPTPAPAAQIKQAQPGQPFKLGNFTYNIKGASVHKSLGNRFSKETPSPGAVFVVVSFTERNDGNETSTGMGSPIEIHDSTGRQYQTSSRVETALMMAGGNHEILPQLQPGITREGQAGFEIPQESANAPVNIVVKERGIFGTGQIAVPMILQQ